MLIESERTAPPVRISGVGTTVPVGRLALGLAGNRATSATKSNATERLLGPVALPDRQAQTVGRSSPNPAAIGAGHKHRERFAQQDIVVIACFAQLNGCGIDRRLTISHLGFDAVKSDREAGDRLPAWRPTHSERSILTVNLASSDTSQSGLINSLRDPLVLVEVDALNC